MEECCKKARLEAIKEAQSSIAQAIEKRHSDGSSFAKEWSNHHGLMRCDCDELVQFIKKIKLK